MIFNLTQHPATPEQLAAEVFDPTPEQRAEIVQLLTFDELPYGPPPGGACRREHHAALRLLDPRVGRGDPAGL